MDTTASIVARMLDRRSVCPSRSCKPFFPPKIPLTKKMLVGVLGRAVHGQPIFQVVQKFMCGRCGKTFVGTLEITSGEQGARNLRREFDLQEV